MPTRSPYIAVWPTGRSRASHLALKLADVTLCGIALTGESGSAEGWASCKACLAKAAVASRQKAKSQKKRTSSTARNTRVRKTYGLEPEDVQAISDHQGGVCAICGNRWRDIDHDHKTGEIRGLLCGTDNRRLLTAAKNDPAILRRAADYLENPPAQFVGNFVVPPDPPQPAPRRRRRSA